jgi:hypothetical protein
MNEPAQAVVRTRGRAARVAAEHRRRLQRALLHESHAWHLRADTFDPKCPYCLVERPWPPLTSD